MSANKKLYKTAIPDFQYSFRPSLFIWPDKTLFIGQLHHLDFHSMGTTAINIGLYQPFLVKKENGIFKPSRCAIIPAGCKHEIMAFGNIVASLMIEKNSLDYVSLDKQFSLNSSLVTEIPSINWLAYFKKIYEDKLTKNEINCLLNKLIGVKPKIEKLIDPRINQVLETIRKNPDINHSQEYLASNVGLSSSRFRHLFRDQLGIPFQRYRLWRRVVTAMRILHEHDNLTYAAMEAGFTDSSHFNRCFRNTFGVNPSLVFRNIDRFEVET